MDYFHGLIPWIISMDFVHCLPEQNSWIPWTTEKKNMDIFHGFTGNCPLISFQYSSRILSMDYFHGLFPWILSTVSLDKINGFHGQLEKIHGHFPWIHWKLSTDFVPILQPDIVHGFQGFCPLIPWPLSTDSMDFLQTGT